MNRIDCDEQQWKVYVIYPDGTPAEPSEGRADAGAAPAIPPDQQAPAGLTADQVARFGDATSRALRRLALEQSAIAIDASLAYRTSTLRPYEERPELAVLSGATAAANAIAVARGEYVSTGFEPISEIEYQVSWRASSNSVCRDDGAYIESLLPGIRAALTGAAAPGVETLLQGAS